MAIEDAKKWLEDPELQRLYIPLTKNRHKMPYETLDYLKDHPDVLQEIFQYHTLTILSFMQKYSGKDLELKIRPYLIEMFMLGYLKDTRAFHSICLFLKGIGHYSNVVDREFALSILPSILYQTYDGRYEELESIVRHPDTNDVVVSAALLTLGNLTFEGRYSHKQLSDLCMLCLEELLESGRKPAVDIQAYESFYPIQETVFNLCLNAILTDTFPLIRKLYQNGWVRHLGYRDTYQNRRVRNGLSAPVKHMSSDLCLPSLKYEMLFIYAEYAPAEFDEMLQVLNSRNVMLQEFDEMLDRMDELINMYPQPKESDEYGSTNSRLSSTSQSARNAAAKAKAKKKQAKAARKKSRRK